MKKWKMKQFSSEFNGDSFQSNKRLLIEVSVPYLNTCLFSIQLLFIGTWPHNDCTRAPVYKHSVITIMVKKRKGKLKVLRQGETS